MTKLGRNKLFYTVNIPKRTILKLKIEHINPVVQKNLRKIPTFVKGPHNTYNDATTSDMPESAHECILFCRKITK